MSEKFYVTPDWYKKSDIQNHSGGLHKWDRYAYGYLDAAKQLSDNSLGDGGNPRHLIYPIVFFYRHYLELRLKEIIEHGSVLLDKEFKIPKHHDLMMIWHQAKQVINEIWPDSSKESLLRVTAILTDFGNLDKKSDAFRYPIDKKGAPTLSGIIDLELSLFREKLDPAVADLEGMTTQISVFEEYKSEIRSEYIQYQESRMWV